MNRPITEHLIRKSDRQIVIGVDPHNGDCHGDHDIYVELNKFPSFDEPDKFLVHVTYTWKTSALLSTTGTMEFRDALTYALKRGEELKKELMDAP